MGTADFGFPISHPASPFYAPVSLYPKNHSVQGDVRTSPGTNWPLLCYLQWKNSLKSEIEENAILNTLDATRNSIKTLPFPLPAGSLSVLKLAGLHFLQLFSSRVNL